MKPLVTKAKAGRKRRSSRNRRAFAAKTRKITLPPDADLERLVHDSSPEVLTAVAADARLTEDLALALLNHRDLPREALEA